VEAMFAMGHISLMRKRVLSGFKIFLVFTFFSGCSNDGDIEYGPISRALMNKQLGQNVSLAILDFADKRPPFRRSISERKSNLVGIFFGHYIGINIPMRKLYSDQATAIDVIDAIDSSFKANGFNVVRYNGVPNASSLSDERLAIKGRINEFLIEGVPAWGGIPPSMVATIDIDLMIIDTKYKKTIWTGKIENYRRMGRNRCVFTGTNKIYSFLNTVFSDAIEKTWIDYGMLSTSL
jgi:hypothetical protein